MDTQSRMIEVDEPRLNEILNALDCKDCPLCMVSSCGCARQRGTYRPRSCTEVLTSWMQGEEFPSRVEVDEV